MKIILTLISFFLFTQLNAQTHQVRGHLTDEHQKPVNYAGIFLLSAADSTKVKAVVSDSAGHFNLSNVPKGKYFVKISFIGYQHYKSGPLELNGTELVFNLGRIRLVAEQMSLNTVEIKANKATIVQQLDRMVMNVENSVMAEGGTALALLNKAPGVTMSESGELSLKGRPGTMVMINGKPTYLSGNQLANLLRGTASNTISRIEIMASPSSKYDAAGNGGIVNIILKKQTKAGLNGTVSANGGAGRLARLGGGTSLNYRTEKVSFFGNYNYFYQDLKGSDDVKRDFYRDGMGAGKIPYSSSVQRMDEKAKLRSHNFQAGMELFLNEKNTLGFMVNGGVGKYPAVKPTRNRLYNNETGDVIWDAHTNTIGKERWTDMLYNINYKHLFNDKGHELTADIDYVSHFSKMDQQLDTRFMGTQQLFLPALKSRIGDLPSDNDIYVGKIDYVLPAGKLGKLEAGWKGSVVRMVNNLKYDTLQNGTYVPDHSTSNDFIYKEQIQAGYVNLKKDIGKFSIQAGLRGEYTDTKGHQLTTDSLVKRSYFKLFPSVFLTQEINDKNRVQLSYSKRIERPGYWDMNPFRVYMDPFSYEEGNPYLLPSIVNAFELSYGFRSRYYTTLTYNASTDVISSLVGGDSNLAFQRPENLATFKNYGISFTASVDFTKWWSGTHFANLFSNDFSIAAPEGEQRIKGTSFTFDSQNTFKLGNGWKAELSGMYKSKVVSGVFTTKSYYMVSAGGQKEILKDRGTLKLLVNDIFQSKQIKQSATYGNISAYSHSRPDSRAVVLSFSYRFGGDGAGGKQRSTASEDLKGRLK
ncbi:TonB-dependent receptor [Pedobacter cryoconitis]|uniref:TonB-dependent receptor n=1 Tax=Pedobacter cryoconitis TaxID=188932 RepID=A0A127VIE8_9SPHI|nr:outer membrane beta-barrel family protein [Pedobacter cryoconitis]AMQ01038.1 TonB-dependent receptor [Pedobacter cryoconitis]